LARKLDAVEFVVREMEADPSNRSIADDALTRFSNLRWALTDVQDDLQKRDRCLALGRRAMELAKAHPDVTQHVQLAGATVACALDAEEAMPADDKTDRPTDDFIIDNADYLLQAFGELKLDPDEIGQSFEQIAELIERVQQIAEANGDLTRAENVASRIIDVLNRLRPQLDYDYFTIKKISVAHLAIGDYRRKANDVAEAVRHYRICADPEQVAYPLSDCMDRVIAMIQAGHLGPGHEAEAATLRDRISLYKRENYTLTNGLDINNGAVNIPFSFYVSMPPRGYEGIDAQATWWRRVRGLEVPQDAIEEFRELDRLARARHVPLVEVAVYTLGVNADKAAEVEIAKAFKDGDSHGALDRTETLYSKVDQENTSDVIGRQIGIIGTLANGLKVIGEKNDPTDLKAFASALDRTRRLVITDRDTPAADPIQRAFTELLLDVGEAQTDTQGKRAKDLFAEAVAICRQMIDEGSAEQRWRAGLGRSLWELAGVEETTDGARAALPHISEAVDIERERYIASRKASEEARAYSATLLELTSVAADAHAYDTALSAGREAVDLLRALTASDEKQKPTLARSLWTLAIVENETGGPQTALSHMTEAVDIERERYIASGKASGEAKVYASALLRLASIADDARAYDAALSASQEAVELRRMLAVSDEKERPDLARSLVVLAEVEKKR
jgi:tetratricopeptide (TPR) repeat protein